MNQAFHGKKLHVFLLKFNHFGQKMLTSGLFNSKANLLLQIPHSYIKFDEYIGS
ncbi:hypothetical protein O3M35_009403 [Rhynocoris fuscipes]|uniref:Uncharacterized protein n=1 Tax=Rhynocoris fuscipes TaxID=488301 RepID=A0AAW1D5Q8_9HEMI